ncbi:hypothetical protein GEMRC1_001894 [Eukaryota sp. GEM-RC1]
MSFLPLLRSKKCLPIFTQDTEETVSDEQFSSESSFIVSLSAAAVGLGNMIRFPYVVGLNGGAAYIIAQLLVLIVMAFPIMFLEVALGRLTKSPVIASLRSVKKKTGTALGWLTVILTIAITSYYLVVTGWCFGYAVESVIGKTVVFSQFTTGYRSLTYFLLTTVLCSVVLTQSVKFLERVCKIVMPLLILLMLVLSGLAASTTGFSGSNEVHF